MNYRIFTLTLLFVGFLQIFAQNKAVMSGQVDLSPGPSDEEKIYDLTGRLIASEAQMTKGIYILKSKNTTHKILK